MSGKSGERTEAALVEAAQKGDLPSFGVLYERYYGSLVALAYSMLGDVQLSEDAAQEAFAIACRDLPKLRNTSKFGSWVVRICRNTAYQMLRVRRRTSDIQGVVATETEYGVTDRVEGVRRAVWNLRDAEREVLVLHYYDNMAYAKIASVLGISVAAVHGRLTRARWKVEDYLKRNGLASDDYGTQ